MQKKYKPLVAMAVTAVLAAVAFVLYYFLEFPLFPPPVDFLKLNFSDIPALLGALIFGPGYGALIELLKNVLQMITKGVVTQMGFGNLMDFTIGISFILPYTLVVRRARNQRASWKILLAAAAAGMTGIVVAGLGMNLLITPLFFRFFLKIPMTIKDAWGIIGFSTALNAIKGGILVTAGTLLARTSIKATLEKYLR